MAPKLRLREAGETSSSVGHGTATRGRRGRGRGIRGGRIRRGHGGHGGAAAAAAAARGPASHEGIFNHDFVVNIRSRIRHRVELPLSFAIAMVDFEPSGLFLCSNGCPYGPIWVETRFEDQTSMFLEKGWKTFARWYDLRRGDSLCCRFDGKDTLLVKAFNSHGDRLECCAESSSGADSQNEDDSGGSSAKGNHGGRIITSSGFLDPSSDEGVHGGGGGDSYSSYEEDAEDVKLIPRRARK